MTASISPDSLSDLTEGLRTANEEFTTLYPGDTGRRQPVHTVYGGAHLFKSDSAPHLGSLALRSLDQFAPNFVVFAHALDLPGATQLPKALSEAEVLISSLKNDPVRFRSGNKEAWLAHTIYKRVYEKLRQEPVEDFRI